MKLNSLLKTNLDGITNLQDSIPGFFELEAGNSVFFSFKLPVLTQLRSFVKFQVNKIQSNTLSGNDRLFIYASDFYRKPNSSNALMSTDVSDKHVTVML